MSYLTVTPAATGEQKHQAKGRVLVAGANCLCGDEVKADDLVAANFDKRQVHTGGGLYLVQSDDGWSGCRRMTRVPNGVAIDRDCEGDWATFEFIEDCGLQVVATVETVYKPTRYE